MVLIFAQKVQNVLKLVQKLLISFLFCENAKVKNAKVKNRACVKFNTPEK